MESIIINHKKYVVDLFLAFSKDRSVSLSGVDYSLKSEVSGNELIWEVARKDKPDAIDNVYCRIIISRDSKELKSIDAWDIIKFFSFEWNNIFYKHYQPLSLAELSQKAENEKEKGDTGISVQSILAFKKWYDKQPGTTVKINDEDVVGEFVTYLMTPEI